MGLLLSVAVWNKRSVLSGWLVGLAGFGIGFCVRLLKMKLEMHLMTSMNFMLQVNGLPALSATMSMVLMTRENLARSTLKMQFSRALILAIPAEKMPAVPSTRAAATVIVM